MNVLPFRDWKYRPNAPKNMSFRNSALLLIAINICGVILVNVRNIAIAESISHAALGQLTILWSYAAIPTMVFSLGWPAILTRNIAKDPENIVQLGFAIFSTQLLLLAFCVLVWIALSLFGRDVPFILKMACPVSAVGILSSLFLATLEGYRKVIWSRLMQGIIRPVLTVGITVSMFYIGNIYPSKSFLYGQLLYLLIILIILNFFIKNHGYKLTYLFENPAIKTRFNLKREHMLVLAISGLNTLMLSEDVLILHYYVNDAAIGQYGIITAIVGLIAIGKSAVNAIFVPDFAKSIQEKRSPDAKNLFNLSRTLSTLWAVFALGILLLVFAFAPQWVAIPRKSIFLSIIIFLALGKLSSAMIGPCTNVMFINGGAALIAWSVLTACVLNFFGNLALVPFYGLLGAAISTGLSIMALNLWQFAHVKKRYKF